MGKADQNKEFILQYIHALNEADDKLQVISNYTSDPKLIERITFLEETFPHYQIIIDEVTAEANRVIVRARLVGQYSAQDRGTDPSLKRMQIPLAIGYQVEKKKIVGHWLITDQLDLLRQSVDIAP